MQPILDRAAEDVAGVSCHIEMPQGRRHYCGPEMKFSAPPDAQGHAGVLTPEDAFVAAVNSCVMMMFIWATERFRLKLLSFEFRTEGTKLIELDRTEIFTRLYFKPVIRIARGDESKQAVEARTRRALEAAQKYIWSRIP